MSRLDVNELNRALDGFAGRRVTVLGDLIADQFYWGDISRISREAPVLVLEHRRTICAPGGAGNSVANLRTLGARPYPIGIVGRDSGGRRLIDRLREIGVSTSGILRVAEYETPTKTRVLAGGRHTRRQQIVRLDEGERRGDLPARLQQRLRMVLRKALRQSAGLLVADYGYGAASPAVLSSVLPLVKSLGLTVTADSRERVAEFRGITACTPNQEEVQNALNLESIDGAQTLVEAGRALLRKTGDDAVLITRGPEGMSLFRRGKQPLHIKAFGSDEVADVTGAGDTVIAAFTLALIAGGTPETAARLANYAAGKVVTKAGTATVSQEELREAVHEDGSR